VRPLRKQRGHWNPSFLARREMSQYLTSAVKHDQQRGLQLMDEAAVLAKALKVDFIILHGYSKPEPLATFDRCLAVAISWIYRQCS